MRAGVEFQVAVRLASSGDASFIRELSRLAFSEYDPHASRATARMMLERGARTLVAESLGRPLGFIILHASSFRDLAIHAIAVSPSERGRRVGQRLMRAAEHHARSLGCTRITLTTAQANLAALDLFLRFGFKITSRGTRYHGKQPACHLEKRVV
ncbi:MAG: GNAT family N-acetyltransferase [Myxococcales bacterium]|nr:MAG: GNAT family N-acetyltransferase [Myxococcales bacterium]